MGSHRIERVNEQLKREISRMVVGELKDPRIHSATVTRVSAAPDLTFAKVMVQLLGEESDREETLEGLRAAIPYIRSQLADRVRMKRVPELQFERDRSMEHAMRIEELLRDAATGEERAAADGEEAVEETDGADDGAGHEG